VLLSTYLVGLIAKLVLARDTRDLENQVTNLARQISVQHAKMVMYILNDHKIYIQILCIGTGLTSTDC
jgi:hypothetical protein